MVPRTKQMKYAPYFRRKWQIYTYIRLEMLENDTLWAAHTVLYGIYMGVPPRPPPPPPPQRYVDIGGEVDWVGGGRQEFSLPSIKLQIMRLLRIWWTEYSVFLRHLIVSFRHDFKYGILFSCLSVNWPSLPKTSSTSSRNRSWASGLVARRYRIQRMVVPVCCRVEVKWWS